MGSCNPEAPWIVNSERKSGLLVADLAAKDTSLPTAQCQPNYDKAHANSGVGKQNNNQIPKSHVAFTSSVIRPKPPQVELLHDHIRSNLGCT